MKSTYKLVFLVSSFANGLVAPVLSFLFLSHGASMVTLSLFVGLYAMTVVLCELPSGIAADLFGRRRIFVLAHLFLFFSYLVLLASRKAAFLALSCVLMGLGRAFASGSLEALVVEQHMEERGADSVGKISRQLATTDALGLTAGALSGGFLAWLDESYLAILLTLASAEFLAALLPLLYIAEQPAMPSAVQNMLAANIRNMRKTMAADGIVLQIFLMSIVLGIFLSTIETYWQPQLSFLLPKQLGWLFGAVNCLGYLGTALGSLLAGTLLAPARKNASGKNSLTAKSQTDAVPLYHRVYLASRIPLSFLLAFMGLNRNWLLFLLAYALIYFLIGFGNLFETTLFHLHIAGENRAAMLSFSSLCLRGGGMVTAALGSLLVRANGTRAVWIWLPFLIFVLTAVCAASFRRNPC